LVDGHDNVPQGVRGGLSPAAHTTYKLDVDGRRVDVPQIGVVVLEPGERIVEVGGGGAGYGVPWERAPDLVRADVEAGVVSAERAREVYRVVVLPPDGGRLSWQVDLVATARARQLVVGGE
jgi:N-methylhydantoinase B